MPVKVLKLADIKKIDYLVLPNNQRKTISSLLSMLKSQGKTPDYIINGTMFSTTNGETVTDSKDEYKFINGGNYASQGIAIKNNKDLSWMTTYNSRNDSTVRDYIGSAPTLLIDGKINLDTKGLSSSFYNTNKIRSFVGFNDESFIIGCTGSPITCNATAKVCQDYGMKYAVNLDGGGSSVMAEVVNGQLKLLNKPTETRPLPNWILIYMNKEEEETPMDKIKLNYDGNIIELNGIFKDGRNYIELRELSQLGFTISYDNVNKIPIIKKIE